MKREFELDVTTEEFVRRLREIAYAIEHNDTYTISVQDAVLRVPPQARCRIEYEQTGSHIELELELRWSTTDELPNGEAGVEAKNALS